MVTPPKYLSVSETGVFAAFRPVGDFTLKESVALIDEALEFCRINRINRILVNIMDVTGLQSPSVIERFALGCQWAQTVDSRLSLGMVAPESLIDEEKIGVTIARNRGLRSEVFTDEAAAIEWLISSNDHIS